MSSNYSIFSIPAYLVLAMVPHSYGMYVLRAANKGTWDNSNPRSSMTQTVAQKSVSPEAFRTFERSKAAHSNMMENSAFVIGAVLCGVSTRLSSGFMNRAMGWYLASRVLYMISYIRTTQAPWTYLRTLFFALGNVVLFTIYIKAGNTLLV